MPFEIYQFHTPAPVERKNPISTLSNAEILALPITEDGIETETIGQYLARILRQFWILETSFNKTAPLGEYAWKIPVIRALDHGGVSEVRKWSHDGSPLEYDHKQFEAIMDAALNHLTSADYSTLALPPEPKEWYVVRILPNEDGIPVLADRFKDPRTKDDAEIILEDRISQKGWTMVQIPK